MSRTLSPRFLIAALILSLALNVCIVGGAVYAHWSRHRLPPMPGHRLDLLAEHLKLRPEQMPEFEEFRRTLRHEQEQLAERDRPVMREAWDELTKDNPDPLKVEAALDQMALHRHAFQIDTAAAAIRFMGSLTHDQRETAEHFVLDHHGPADPLLRNVGK